MKVLVGMSGGVDSAVTAALLLEQGHECIGCTMVLHSDASQEISDAKAVCAQLGIRHEVIDFTEDFRKYVIDDFVTSYYEGKTPNPCLNCNRYLKFGLMYDRMLALGCDHIATGHYARILRDESGRYVLARSADITKDQSYVLFSLTEEQLAATLFPLGDFTKDMVREVAARYGFVNASKPESQDICFVPDGDYASVISSYSDRISPPGDFVDTSGQVLGRHKGIIHYTIGQRRGLSLPSSERIYVLKIDPSDNTVVLGSDEQLYTTSLRCSEVNLISELPATFHCMACVRYRGRLAPATVRMTGKASAEVVFEIPQRAITPGQGVVFYDGDTVLGGGVITT